VTAAIAGSHGIDGPAPDEELDLLIVPGMAVSARAPGLVACGDGRVERGGTAVVHGVTERAEGIVGNGGVVLRRDAIGMRPLFYAVSSDGNRIAWASRLTQLARLPWVDLSVDWDTAADRMAARFSHPERTWFTGIRELPAGHRLEWHPGRTQMTQEWTPERFLWDGGKGPREPEAEFAARLVEATGRRCRDDSSVLLSGGLDSPAVAAAAVRAGFRPKTVSSVFPRFPSVDETDRILAVRESLGLTGDLIEVSHPGAEELDAELDLHGQPHLAVNIGHLSGLLAAAADLGHRRFLDGHDGDGALGAMNRLSPLLLRRPGLAIDALSWSIVGGWRRRDTLRSWAGDAAPPWMRRLARVGRGPAPDPLAHLRWLGPDILGRVRTGRSVADWRAAQLRGVGPMLAHTLVTFALVADAAGVELAHPFADRELLEFLLGLPPEAKHLRGRWKGLVREGFPELPAAVRDQTGKTAFDAAVAAAHPLSRMAIEVVDPPVRLPGVDYDLLAARMAGGGAYTIGDVVFLRRLALTHRFLTRQCCTAVTA